MGMSLRFERGSHWDDGFSRNSGWEMGIETPSGPPK